MATASSSSFEPVDSSPDHNPWGPRTAHANGSPPDLDLQPLPPNSHLPPTANSPRPQHPTTDHTRSPSRIALRAHILGLLLGASLLLTLELLHHHPSPLWRLPFFALALALFHWLEFYTTALYNPPAATVSAFLLNNGAAYNTAHALAFLECFVHYYFFPLWTWGSLGGGGGWGKQQQVWGLSLGLALMVVGQGVRTVAMATAGRSFAHLVQTTRKEGHVLVTGGVYAWLRHPSYWGFFWWGVGSQVVLGNGVCAVGYAWVLWRFFGRRIAKEEELLVQFFGEDYVRYRERTWVGIPFIS